MITCEIVDSNVPNVLCLHDSLRLKLIKRIDVVQIDTNNLQNKQKNNVSLQNGNHDLVNALSKCSHEEIKSVILEYSDVFGGIGKMPGKVSLKYDSSVTPVVHSSRPIPAALRDPAKNKLDSLEKSDIIEKVPIGTPTQWCSSTHIVLKKNTNADIDVRLTM